MVVLMNGIRRYWFSAAVLAGGLAVSTPRQMASPGDETRAITVTAERFSFTPSEIRLNAGVETEIRLRSDDTAHGFHIVGTNVDVAIPKRGRGEAVVRVALEPGRYTFECSQICGAGHDFMRGTIIVSK
jgi:cytochrome c oxidase subunit 2